VRHFHYRQRNVGPSGLGISKNSLTTALRPWLLNAAPSAL